MFPLLCAGPGVYDHKYWKDMGTFDSFRTRKLIEEKKGTGPATVAPGGTARKFKRSKWNLTFH